LIVYIALFNIRIWLRVVSFIEKIINLVKWKIFANVKLLKLLIIIIVIVCVGDIISLSQTLTNIITL